MTTTRKPRKAPQTTDSRALLDGQVGESALQKAVVDLAHTLGYLCHHVYDSRLASANVDKGFPDWIFCKAGRVLAVELKKEDGKVSAAQSHWLLELSWLGRVETYVWRPRDLSSGKIERVLLGESGERVA